MKWLHALSDALTRLGERHGLVPAFAFAAFLEATFVPLIIDLIMLSFLMTGQVRLWKLITAGAAASIAGTMLFWIAGTMNPTLPTTIATWMDIAPETLDTLQAQFAQNWIQATWVAMMTAVPDALVALWAGTQGISFFLFGAVTSAALLTRFALLGGIVWLVAIVLQKTGTDATKLITALSLIGSLLLALAGALTALL